MLSGLPENDPLFPDDVRVSGQKSLEDKQIEHEVKVYPGVPHGKSCRVLVLFCELLHFGLMP